MHIICRCATDLDSTACCEKMCLNHLQVIYSKALHDKRLVCRLLWIANSRHCY